VITQDIGLYQYTSDPHYLPDGLAGFQSQIKLPFVTHAR
jgi:hypothetical protein